MLYFIKALCKNSGSGFSLVTTSFVYHLILSLIYQIKNDYHRLISKALII